MYDVVVDVARYREFVPWCIRSDILKPTYPNIFKARMEIGFQVVKEQYTALVTHQKPGLVKVGWFLPRIVDDHCSTDLDSLVCLYGWSSIQSFDYGVAFFTQ